MEIKTKFPETEMDWAELRGKLSMIPRAKAEKMIEDAVRDVILRHFKGGESALVEVFKSRIKSRMEGPVKHPDIGTGEEE